MARSERRQKVQFYVWLVCLIIVQSGIWYILLSEDCSLFFGARILLVAISLLSLVCLYGLWYCWMNTKHNRQSYMDMKQEQQNEMNEMLSEIEKARGKRINQ